MENKIDQLLERLEGRMIDIDKRLLDKQQMDAVVDVHIANLLAARDKLDSQYNHIQAQIIDLIRQQAHLTALAKQTQILKVTFISALVTGFIGLVFFIIKSFWSNP